VGLIAGLFCVGEAEEDVLLKGVGVIELRDELIDTEMALEGEAWDEKSLLLKTDDDLEEDWTHSSYSSHKYSIYFQRRNKN
jgi:hypothetical protein